MSDFEEYDPDKVQVKETVEDVKPQEYEPGFDFCIADILASNQEQYADHRQSTHSRVGEYERDDQRQHQYAENRGHIEYEDQRYSERSRSYEKSRRPLPSFRTNGYKQTREFKLFLSNLPPELKQEELKSFLKTIVPLKDVVLRSTPPHKHFAFVTVSSLDDFYTLLDCDGFEINGNRVRIRESEDRSRYVPYKRHSP